MTRIGRINIVSAAGAAAAAALITFGFILLPSICHAFPTTRIVQQPVVLLGYYNGKETSFCHDYFTNSKPASRNHRHHSSLSMLHSNDILIPSIQFQRRPRQRRRGVVTTSKSPFGYRSADTRSSRYPIKNTSAAVALDGSDSSASSSTNVHDHITAMDYTILVTTTVLAMLMSSLAVWFSGPGGWRYYLAGGICASTSHAITTPIDVVKTRQQVDIQMKEETFIKAFYSIVRKESPQILLSGLGPTTFGYLVEGAAKFGVYEVLKPIIKNLMANAASATSISVLNSKLVGFATCGAISGIVASAMLCPMEALRIRLVAEPKLGKKGWIKGGMLMLKYEGVKGLWKGMYAMMTKQVPYTIAKQVSFDVFTTSAYAYAKSMSLVVDAKTKALVPFCCAFLASVISAVCSQPGDMLLSVVNAHEGNMTTKDHAKDIWKKDGIRGFFVGMKARFLHVGIIVTMQLLIYDFVKRLCGIAPTGSVG